MKQSLITITLCLTALTFLPGCSKSKNASPTASSAGSQPGSDSTTPANGATELKLKWEDGKTYSMEMDLSQSSETDIPNRPQPMEQVMKYTQGFHYAPKKDLDGGGSLVELEFDSSSLNLTQNGRSLISFDSMQNTPMTGNNPASQVGAVMKAMLGVPLEYTFGADGKVEKIDGTDVLQSRINAAAPNPQQRAQMQQMFSDNTLKQYGSLAESLPDHPVNVGDTWTVNRDQVTPAGAMTMNMTYTFKEWQELDGHNCAHLVATGDIKSKDPYMMGGMTIDIQSGTITGDDWFDPALGMMIAVNSDQDITAKITMRARVMMQKMKQNIRMSLVELTQ